MNRRLEIEMAFIEPRGVGYAELSVVADTLLEAGRLEPHVDPRLLAVAACDGVTIDGCSRIADLPGGQLGYYDARWHSVRFWDTPDTAYTGLNVYLGLADYLVRTVASLQSTDVGPPDQRWSTVVRLAARIALPDVGYTEANELAMQAYLPTWFIEQYQAYRRNVRRRAAANRSGTYEAVSRRLASTR